VAFGSPKPLSKGGFFFFPRMSIPHPAVRLRIVMTYMLLIYTPDIGRDRTDEEWAAMVEPFVAYNEYVKATGFRVPPPGARPRSADRPDAQCARRFDDS
jgi:hypothetical protein